MITKVETPLRLETLFSLTHQLRQDGKTIGFTHGAFDLFHVGHIHLLRESRKLCDVLIVAVENDQNFRQYKKKLGRPIISAHDRLKVVNQISAVSFAFINYLPVVPESYEYLYRELHTDFVAIGRHFGANDQIRGQVEHAGVKLVRFEDDHESTSRIINRINRRAYRSLHL